MEPNLTVAMIRRCKKELENMEPHQNAWPQLFRIYADDLRIREMCEAHQRDYRARHAAAITLEIEAFEEWQNEPDPAEERLKRRAASILRARNWK